jgi:SHS2 domain-containing protein
VYRWVDHTGELELEIEADSEEGAFRETLVALGELLAERAAPDGEAATCEVHLATSDRAALLAEWATELAYLAESFGLVPERADRLELAGDTLDATVSGRCAFPSHLIKAVTYHRLGMWEMGGAWRARIVFDV